MPLLLLLILAATAGLAVGGAVTAGRGVAPRRALLVVAVAGGLLFALLTFLVSRASDPFAIDRTVASWAYDHASELSKRGLEVITQLGSIRTIAVLCVVLAAVETRRRRSLWVVGFLAAIIAGEEALALGFKALVDRPRPTLSSAASSLGPAFPSGHSTNAAAFYTAAALVLAQRLDARGRGALFGGAVCIAVAVAGSRVLLDLHWLTDVIAGLALGWAWFAVCALAFGRGAVRDAAPSETQRRSRSKLSS